MTTESEWTCDPHRAMNEACTQPRPMSAAPHWVRCEWFHDGVRCRLAEGHPGKHESVAPAVRRTEVSNG